MSMDSDPLKHLPSNQENKPPVDTGSGKFIWWILRDGPLWGRALAILSVLVVFVTPASLQIMDKIHGWKESKDNAEIASTLRSVVAQSAIAYPMSQGTLDNTSPGNANNDSQNRSATQVITSDQLHFLTHLQNPLEDPQWTTFEKSDKNNFLSYKFYGKSDKCLLVARVERGTGVAQWFRDPLSAPHVSPNSGAERSTLQPDIHNFLNVVPLFAAANYTFPQLPGIENQSQRMQTSCLNPHPGAFRYWWGPPVDQCWSPLYRQFNDGCTHYQMYSRCNGVWGPVVWTVCNTPHHG